MDASFIYTHTRLPRALAGIIADYAVMTDLDAMFAIISRKTPCMIQMPAGPSVALVPSDTDDSIPWFAVEGRMFHIDALVSLFIPVNQDVRRSKAAQRMFAGDVIKYDAFLAGLRRCIDAVTTSGHWVRSTY